MLDSEEDGAGYRALQVELLGDGGPQRPVLIEQLQRLAKAHAKAGADHSNPAKVRFQDFLVLEYL